MRHHLPGKRTFFVRSVFPVLLIVVILFLSACVPDAGKALTVSVAEQYGLAYAPLQIMREKGFLEAAMQDREKGGRPVTVNWVRLANTSAIREAMLANEIDVAFTGIPPFLLGVDQGMPWRMITGLSRCPVDMYVNDPSLTTLAALVGKHRIALPQPGSIQHVLLAMAAERELDRADIFDRQLVSMKHPDGMQALLSGKDITAHFTAPPYSFLEEDTAGIHPLLRGESAMGEPYSFLVGIAEPEFYEDTLRLDAFRDALERAILFIAENPGETARLLAESYGLTPEETETYLYGRDIFFETEIRGTETFVDFMVRTGYLQRRLALRELVPEEK